MRAASWLFTCVLVAILPSQHSGAQGPIPRSRHCGSVAEVLIPILPALRAGTELPLRLPSTIPFADRDNPVYASITYLSRSSYDIELSTEPDCAGANSCRVAQLHGVEGRRQSQQKATSTVILRRGVVAGFLPSKCGGAGCTDATLSWSEGKYSYSIDMKAASKKDLLQMARSICHDEVGPKP